MLKFWKTNCQFFKNKKFKIKTLSLKFGGWAYSTWNVVFQCCWTLVSLWMSFSQNANKINKYCKLEKNPFRTKNEQQQQQFIRQIHTLRAFWCHHVLIHKTNSQAKSIWCHLYWLIRQIYNLKHCMPLSCVVHYI